MTDRPFSVVNVALGAGVTLHPVPLERLNVPRSGRGVVAIPTDPCAPSYLAFAFDPANEGARTFCRHFKGRPRDIAAGRVGADIRQCAIQPSPT